MSNPVMPDPATFARAEEEYALAESNYKNKLHALVAAARAILAATFADANINPADRGTGQTH
jgi:hypothetical protein